MIDMYKIHSIPRIIETGFEHGNSKSLKATLHFLPRDPVYDTEKPYSIQYVPHGDTPQTNVYQDIVNGLPIRDVRDILDNLNFEENGFIVRELNSEMAYEGFADPDLVRAVYVPEVCNLLKKELGTKNVAVLEYLVRRRDPSFPISTGSEFEFAQPVATAHIDFSPNCVREILEDRYENRAAELMKHRFQVVNVWKPLIGPLRDWPLCLCHPASLSPERDLELMDRVYPLNVEESIQIYYADSQDWCYLRDQMPNEVMIFRGADSTMGIRGGVPHCSFKNPDSPPDQAPRESIEIRALVVYADEDLSMERVSPTRRHGPKSTFQQS